jgi:hypothetical protein
VSFVYTKSNEYSSVGSAVFVETRGHNHNAKPDFLTKRNKTKKTKLRGLQSASELYGPSDCPLSAKLVPTFGDRGCRVVSATDPPGG